MGWWDFLIFPYVVFMAITHNPLALAATVFNILIPVFFIRGWLVNRPIVMTGLLTAEPGWKGARYFFQPDPAAGERPHQAAPVRLASKTASDLMASDIGFSLERPLAASFLFMRSSVCAVQIGHRLIYSRPEAIKIIRWLNVGGWRWLSTIGLAFMSFFGFAMCFYLSRLQGRVTEDDFNRLALPWVPASLALAALGWKALADLRVQTMIQRVEAALPDLKPESEPCSIPGRPPLPKLWPAVITLVLVALFGLVQVYYMLSF